MDEVSISVTKQVRIRLLSYIRLAVLFVLVKIYFSMLDKWGRKAKIISWISHTQFLALILACFLMRVVTPIGFGGLGVVCWPLVPKFVGSNPAEAVRFLGRKILSTPSFGGEVKPLVPCRRFAACKRSLNLRGSRNLGKITRQISRCTWRQKWERLKAEESNGKLPPKSCPGCSVPEPYRSHDWALVPANPASKAEY